MTKLSRTKLPPQNVTFCGFYSVHRRVDLNYHESDDINITGIYYDVRINTYPAVRQCR
jgi:hypothetical protein